MQRAICFLYSVCLALPASSSEVYRWVDSEGKIHYGDQAPEGQRDKAARLAIKTDAAKIDPEAEKMRQQMRSIEEGRQRERAFEAQKAAQDQQRREQLAKRCKSLQNEIRDDQNVAVFYRYDDAGNRVLWSSEERLAYREKLHTLKQAYCSDLAD